MKTFSKTLLASALVAASSMGASVANAEVEIAASVSASNMYLWRGFDLGDGSAAISGDLVASVGGAYAGLWASSGDDALGNEYDIFVGYGGEVGDFSYDINYTTYMYPDSDLGEPVGPGDVAEIILTLGYGPVSLGYYDVVACDGCEDAEDQTYINLSASFGAFTFAYGVFDTFGGDEESEPSHFDISYAYNDNLSFTYSTLVEDDGFDYDPLFAITLSLPIE